MDGSMFIGTWWSLVPPLLAIALALITKEVYSSLFIGVAMGALLYTGFHPWNAFVALFDIMKNSMNLNILIFDVLLGDSGIIGTTKKNLDFTGVSLA